MTIQKQFAFLNTECEPDTPRSDKPSVTRLDAANQPTSPSTRSSKRLNHTPLSSTPDQASQTDSLETLSSCSVRRLVNEVRQLENRATRHADLPAISTGCEPLNACLPDSGYTRGSLIEYLRASPACGASFLALKTAAEAMHSAQGHLVVVDPHKQFYPPALIGHHIDLAKVVFVHPQTPSDTIWAIDQALRTQAVSAVIGEINSLDDRAARRLQLAALQGQGLGLLLRSISAKYAPSWAEVQWTIRSFSRTTPKFSPYAQQMNLRDRGLQVQLTRVRGATPGRILHLKIDAQSGDIELLSRNHQPHAKQNSSSPGALHLASQLANSKSASRRANTG